MYGPLKWTTPKKSIFICRLLSGPYAKIGHFRVWLLKRTTRKNWFSRAGLLNGPHAKIPLTHFKFFTSSPFLSFLFSITSLSLSHVLSSPLLSISSSLLGKRWSGGRSGERLGKWRRRIEVEAKNEKRIQRYAPNQRFSSNRHVLSPPLYSYSSLMPLIPMLRNQFSHMYGYLSWFYSYMGLYIMEGCYRIVMHTD